jgi:hypothetical protein
MRREPSVAQLDIVLDAALARELELISVPSTRRGRLDRREAVGLVAAAYSSLPTRMSVSSRSFTTAASTFSSGSPDGRGRRRARSEVGEAGAERRQPLVLVGVAHLAPARVVPVLLAAAASRPVAWMCPSAAGRSTRRSHAGG